MRFWLWTAVAFVFLVLAFAVILPDFHNVAVYARGGTPPSPPPSRWSHIDLLFIILAVLAQWRAIQSARRPEKQGAQSSGLPR
jgi:hypothetical protein